ncbi:MAG: hypothetical protein KC635_00655 [Myxococcales bacterium]|nr:hypothetical protein [Myxococcales bacterium]MCB9736764.1 hypothetical protein [Deltaproteobacteria bacterium]
MSRPQPVERAPRRKRLEIVNAMLLLVVLINVLQLWLFTATVHAVLGGDAEPVWPAGLASLACLGLNLGLLWYLRRLDR